jgi:hypothetical protein
MPEEVLRGALAALSRKQPTEALLQAGCKLCLQTKKHKARRQQKFSVGPA